MTFLDRLRDPVFTSPSGVTFSPDIRDVSREGAKKTSIHEFPNQNTAAIQEAGLESKPFEIQAIFNGDDYDLIADQFFIAIGEPGTATLTHPRWGDIIVMVLTWKQTEGLVENMRSAIFDISMVKYDSAKWPSTAVNQQANVATQIAIANAVISSVPVVPESMADLSAIGNLAVPSVDVLAILNGISGGIDSITAVIDGAVAEVNSAIASVEGFGTKLVSSTMKLINAPLNAINSVGAQVNGFFALAQTTVDAFTDTIGGYISIGQATIAFVTQAGSLAGAIGATSVGEPATNATAASNDAAAVGNIVAAVSKNIETIESACPDFVVPYEIVQMLKQAARDAIDGILAQAVNLPSERRIITNADKTPLDLAFELYGTAEKVGSVISENKLTGSQIFSVPAGTKVVYYE